jgi:transposase
VQLKLHKSQEYYIFEIRNLKIKTQGLMQTQRKELNFEGQNIFVGIDVHLKGWNVSIYTEDLYHKSFNQLPNAESLSTYLKLNFPNAIYHSVYEAGFCGLHAHYELTNLGIHNIVTNPADVPTTDKEKKRKTDKVDSNKLARSLRNKELKGIYTPSQDILEDRSFVRVRSSIVKDLSRMKNRLKSMLYFYGIEFPEEFQKSTTHWSKRFMVWLKTIQLKSHSGNMALALSIKEAEQLRTLLLEVNKELKALSIAEKYAKKMEFIRSVPGFGLVAGMLFLSEIENINRFENNNKFAGMIGIVPDCHSSGDNEQIGAISPRRHIHLRRVLIESSWIAVRIDPALSRAFSEYCKRMEPNKAIIRIARKLSNRIYFVLKNEKKYETRIVK